jgi:hypothetical protein
VAASCLLTQTQASSNSKRDLAHANMSRAAAKFTTQNYHDSTGRGKNATDAPYLKKQPRPANTVGLQQPTEQGAPCRLDGHMRGARIEFHSLRIRNRAMGYVGLTTFLVACLRMLLVAGHIAPRGPGRRCKERREARRPERCGSTSAAKKHHVSPNGVGLVRPEAPTRGISDPANGPRTRRLAGIALPRDAGQYELATFPDNQKSRHCTMPLGFRIVIFA